MRIACLQFASQVGDVDNNLNRADLVLAKADQDDVDSLDLLVLPELAFSGYNFRSPEGITPYLEPSGSGITSLWARTIALKHNTNVVVGYPEKADTSGHIRSGTEYSAGGLEHFNAAILVNSDGETVANYRKTFLYPLDETWAREGKGFFGDHVPGLGNTAIGICTDINPYRSQAPWHAFEFAFHLLEVRANLVIVSMAWVTGEDCEQFTQFPNEPDMEALTYWAQRFEPVIRDESRDEVIIVFCNRTGIEDDAVYAGTSTVIGIHEGEVKVYGVLGRGVKELLVVDTDDPPFANLVMRKEKSYESPSHHKLKPGGQGPSPVGSLERTPTKYHPDEQEQEVRPDTVLKAPVHEGHHLPTPTAPSPTPLSARPRPFATSYHSAEDEEHDMGPRMATTDSSNEHRILGGTVIISFEEDQEEPERDAEACHSALSTVSAGPPPGPGRPSPKLPQSSVIATEPTAFVKRPRDCVDEVESYEHETRHPQSAIRKKPSRSRMLPKTENGIPMRPKTATGIVPIRRKSSRSRETSRGRRGRHRERRSDVEQGGISQSEWLEYLRPRSQSAMTQRHELDDNSILTRPRSPKSRNASRSGRRVDIDPGAGFSERALEFYLKSIATKVGDGSLVDNSPTTHSFVLVRDKIDDPASPRVSSGPGQPSSLKFPSQSKIGASNTHVGPEQSHAVLWTEVSKVGDQEEIRGRRHGRSTSSTEARRASGGSPPARRSSFSAARGRNGSARDCSVDSIRAQVSTSRGSSNPGGNTVPTQTRQKIAGMIRSVRESSLGPPSDPEDEIVSEIALRHPFCRSCGSKLFPSEHTGAPAKVHGSTPPASERTPRMSEESGSDPNRLRRQPPSDDENDKTPTNARLAEASQALGLLSLQTSADELSKLRAPNLSRASIRTLSSYEPSPITRPPRGLDPKALRAMAFGLDQETMRLGVFDPPTKLGFEPAVDASLDDRSMTKIERIHSMGQ